MYGRYARMLNPRTYVIGESIAEAEKWAASRGWKPAKWGYISGVGGLSGKNPRDTVIWDIGNPASAYVRAEMTTNPAFWWKAAGGEVCYRHHWGWEDVCCEFERRLRACSEMAEPSGPLSRDWIPF